MDQTSQTELSVALMRIAEATERQAAATEDHANLLSEMIDAIRSRGDSERESNGSSTMSAEKTAIAHLAYSYARGHGIPSNTEIAKLVGVSRTQTYRWDEYLKEREGLEELDKLRR